MDQKMFDLKKIVGGMAYILIAIFYLLYVEQDYFGSIFVFFSISTGLCFWFYWNFPIKNHWRSLLLLGIILRLIVFLKAPSLSDDFYRYYWDAWVQEQDISPYAETPSEYIAHTVVNHELMDTFDKLNSKNYYSVYPIGSQFIFRTAFNLAGGKMQGFIFFTRLLFLLFESLLIYSCYQWLASSSRFKDGQAILLLILNPFMIIEFIGNLHFDLIFVSLMITAIFQLLKDRLILSGVLLALSLSIKPQVLIFLPFIILLNQKLKSILVFLLAFITTGVLLYAPILIHDSSAGFFNSLELYFRTFEFNASVYYFLRYLGFKISGYNQIAIIGPLLSLLATFTIFLIFLRGILQHRLKAYQRDQAIEDMTIVFVIYLCLSTTVHPWYILPVIVFSILNNNYTLIFWSFIVFLSYSFYDPTMRSYSLLISLCSYIPVIYFFIQKFLSSTRRHN